jgi:hypothetical protein
MEKLLETNEAFREEWEQHNLKVLGLTATDLYDIYTKEPLSGIADINGMKLSAPGVLGTWLRGTGANAVDGALTTFYTDIQTGVSDGALTLALGALPIKLYEVAPYINRFDAGARFPAPLRSTMTPGTAFRKKCRWPWSRPAILHQAHGQDMLTGMNSRSNKMVELGPNSPRRSRSSRCRKRNAQKWVTCFPTSPANGPPAWRPRAFPRTAFLRLHGKPALSRRTAGPRLGQVRAGAGDGSSTTAAAPPVEDRGRGSRRCGSRAGISRSTDSPRSAPGLIGVLMVIICADIVGRNLFGSSLPLVSELGALLLVMIVSCNWPRRSGPTVWRVPKSSSPV